MQNQYNSLVAIAKMNRKKNLKEVIKLYRRNKFPVDEFRELFFREIIKEDSDGHKQRKAIDFLYS